MKIVYDLLYLGEVAIRNFDDYEDPYYLAYKWEKCKCCGQELPSGCLNQKYEWKKANDNVCLAIQEVFKKDLKSFLIANIEELPEQYRNTGTLIVFLLPQDIENYSQKNLNKSEEWMVGLAFINQEWSVGEIIEGTPQELIY